MAPALAAAGCRAIASRSSTPFGPTKRSLNFDQKGIIDVNMIADLLIFKSTNIEKLSLKDLKYVIKNGEIVYTNE